MESTMHFSSVASLKEAWDDLKKQQPQLRTRDAAQKLGVSEAELIASTIGLDAVRLNENWAEIIIACKSLGKVMALTRNEGCVLEHKVNYRDNLTEINWSLRAIYRGKFGFADRNGNLILDDEQEYAPGWVSINIIASKTFENGLFLEAGGINLLNTATPAQPNNPGRVLFLGINIP